jgi:hypothetical protein
VRRQQLPLYPSSLSHSTYQTWESTTLPSIVTKSAIVTVPVSSLIKEALGYFGISQDLLSITGLITAALAIPLNKILNDVKHKTNTDRMMITSL